MTQPYRLASALIVLGFQILLTGKALPQPNFPATTDASVTFDEPVGSAAAVFSSSIFEYSPPVAPQVPSDPTVGAPFTTSTVADQFEILRVYRNGLVETVRSLTSQLQEENERLKPIQQAKFNLEISIRYNRDEYPSKDFFAAQNARASERVKAVQSQIEDAKVHPISVNDMIVLRNELERAQNDTIQSQQNLDTWQNRVDDANRTREETKKQTSVAAKLVSTIGDTIRSNTELLNKLNNSLSNTDEKIASLFGKSDASNQFKKIMSITFAILVAIVIIGFFIIAARDDTVRKAIFSNDSGIQFITLFSLVIAIILFGIVGVLEGKELAALLGGLSGYILGRGTAKPSG